MMMAISTPPEVVDRALAPLDMDGPSPLDARDLETSTGAAFGCWMMCTARIREFALDCLGERNATEIPMRLRETRGNLDWCAGSPEPTEAPAQGPLRRRPGVAVGS